MKHLFLLTSLLIALQAISQNPGTIRGKIVTKPEQPLQKATVILHNAKDSTVIRQTLASQQGLFQFESLPHGNYFLTITAAGFQKFKTPAIQISPNQENAMVPPIVMQPLNKEMAGITVSAKRPLIEQKIDRTVMNVDALVGNAGVSALEVLENAPGVTVDKDGNISLKGKEGVIILIDGRPSQLSGEDLANFLRSMNSGQLDQVEIMTNPPAKYDASGTAGLINIKTKKATNKGYNGTFNLSYTQGRYPKVNESFQFNFRNEKINWFVNAGHHYNEGFGTLIIQRRIFDQPGTLGNYFSQRGHRLMQANGFNGKAGLDYFISKKTTLGIMLNGNSGKSDADQNSYTEIANASNELESIVKADVINHNQWNNLGANINFRQLFNTKGRELSADLDFGNYNMKSDQFMVNAYFDKAGNSLMNADSLVGDLPQHIQLFSGRVDYVHPSKKGGRWEAGIKSSLVLTDNDAIYDSILSGNAVRDLNRSNHFKYEENINAAYLNLNQPLSKRLGLQLGLRMEHTIAKGRQLTSGDDFTRQYVQLFPTAYFQYKLNEKNSLMLNYGRRIKRPSYQSLNPFIRFIDRYMYTTGNPDLKPQLSDNIELAYNWKNRITATVNYSYTGDVVEGIIEQKGQETYRMPSNIASHEQYGLSIASNIPVNKWWTSNISFNAFNNQYKGMADKTPLSLQATSFIINGIQQFKLGKTLTAEVNGRFRNGWYEGVTRAKSVGFVGLGFSQQLMKNKGILRLSVRDIFFTQQFRGETRYGNVDFRFEDIRDTRQVSIGFTYRFSKGKKVAPVQKTGSSNEEQGRIDME